MLVEWGHLRGILHDPAVFEEPFEFRPERHLLPKSEQAAARMELFDRVAFGFGRRCCDILVGAPCFLTYFFVDRAQADSSPKMNCG